MMEALDSDTNRRYLELPRKDKSPTLASANEAIPSIALLNSPSVNGSFTASRISSILRVTRMQLLSRIGLRNGCPFISFWLRSRWQKFLQ